jgi:hypothetical protein
MVSLPLPYKPAKIAEPGNALGRRGAAVFQIKFSGRRR